MFRFGLVPLFVFFSVNWSWAAVSCRKLYLDEYSRLPYYVLASPFDLPFSPIQKIYFKRVSADSGAFIPDTNLVQAQAINTVYYNSIHHKMRALKREILRLGFPSFTSFFAESRIKENLRLLSSEDREYVGVIKQIFDSSTHTFFKAFSKLPGQDGKVFKNQRLPTMPPRIWEEIYKKEYDLDSQQTSLIRARPPGILTQALLMTTKNQAQELPALSIEVSHQSEVYQQALERLRQVQVGKTDGEADREIIADIYFARKQDSENLIFGTLDLGIVRGLLRLKGLSERSIGEFLKRAKRERKNFDESNSKDFLVSEEQAHLGSPFIFDPEARDIMVRVILIKNIPLHLPGWTHPRLIDCAAGFILRETAAQDRQ